MTTAILAQHLLIKHCGLSDKPSSYLENILLPIYTIDNIQCDVYIRLSQSFILLTIETDKQYKMNKEDEPDNIPLYFMTRFEFKDKRINEELFTTILDKWVIDIGELKFDKVSSQFKKQQYFDMWDFLKSIPNISQGEKCSVCYDITQNKCHCRHHICIPCLISLHPDEENDILCPVCRETIGY